MRRMLAVLAVAAGAVIGLGPGSAFAATDALGVDCDQVADNSFQCGNTSPRSTSETWDGTPIDVNVALPDPGEFGAGPYPLVMLFHGYGQSKLPFASLARYTDRGYAVFTMTDRGMYESCGSAASIAADPEGCDGQYVRVLDTRYEVRDAQYFAGRLVDEGLVQPDRIAATGLSYGAGLSMALAALKDRTMLPDGRLVPWKSPAGTPMSLAVAAPFAGWSDLAYSLSPNGRMLDYLRENPYDADHVGVMKTSIVNGLYLTGTTVGRYAPAGTLPSADLTGWLDRLNQGEPYQNDIAFTRMIAEITGFHSSYYIDHSQPPAPLLIATGFTDDIFPVDEALRYYNRMMAEHPGADIGMFFGDFGHQRAQNKADALTAQAELEDRWFDYYLTGTGSKPDNDVIAYTETCPAAEPSGGPYVGGNWKSLAPGEIKVEGGQDEQTIAPDGGDPAVAGAFGVIASAPCAAPSGAKEPGSANYESAPAPAGGFTLLGSPTVVAKFDGAGTGSAIAARLVDVAPGGTKQLVARQLYRPNPGGYQVFQLHPGAWTFEAGHVARLELLAKDASTSPAPLNLANYGRPSDQQRAITVRDLVLRLPVTEAPGALGGLVKPAAPKILPDDRGPVRLAPGYDDSVTMAEWVASRPPEPGPPPAPTVGRLRVAGPAKAKGKWLRIRVRCSSVAASCARSRLIVRADRRQRRARGARALIAMKGGVVVRSGNSRTVRIALTGRARRLLKGRKGLRKLPAKVTVSGRAGESVTRMAVRRTGRVR
jgi:dienelactone hydrolase